MRTKITWRSLLFWGRVDRVKTVLQPYFTELKDYKIFKPGNHVLPFSMDAFRINFLYRLLRFGLVWFREKRRSEESESEIQ